MLLFLINKKSIRHSGGIVCGDSTKETYRNIFEAK